MQGNHLFERMQKATWNLWMVNAIYLIFSLYMVLSRSLYPLLTQQCISCTARVISMANNLFLRVHLIWLSTPHPKPKTSELSQFQL